ncbi:hypothetical protein IJ670_08005 [bacterium]|nr:hypothetical protein [bacterium]
MIQLNVNFTLLNKFFGVPASKIPSYANKDLEDIMKIEASQGNVKAQNYQKILSDPDKLLEIFKLSNLENKLAILQNMSESDLDELLPYLKHEQLVLGLNFFTEEKLVSMSKELPIEELANMILTKFAIMDVLMFMDDSSMNQFIEQPDVDRKYSQAYFEQLGQKQLAMILTNTLGEDFTDKSQDESLEYLNNLDDSKYKRFLLSMERNDKMNLIAGICAQEPELVYLFKNDDMIQPMNMLMKEDKIKLMGNLEDEFIIPMIEELPLDLTQIVLTQIDARDFSEVLARDFQDILSSVVLFSTKSA